ncbi:MAG TPA: DUF4396 domain-containing protein [Baekduia sp.]|nr:DUF4396 domain-containing protein [Baekduia sp.]
MVLPALLPLTPLAAQTQTGSTGWIVVGWVALAVAFACAGAIAWDIAGRGYRQHMGIMNLVWPITALYWGPVAVWGYFTRGRRMSMRWADEHDMDLDEMMSGDRDDPPLFWPFARKNWWPISKGVSHCGAGCTLGDIVGEWIVYLAAWSIPLFAAEDANTLMAMYVADFVLAWTFGIIFQYFSIVPMREDVGRLEGIWLAIKADTFSILSFQIGLFGFMALVHLVLWQPPLTVASPAYWFMMQVGMIIGYFTAWPVNAWLVQKGWKEKM